jgi:hypothetical protein
MSKQILFISHDALHTGAPIVFLHFLRWFKENSEVPFKIVLRNGGPLDTEFAALAPTLVLSQPRQNNLFQKILNRLGVRSSLTSL